MALCVAMFHRSEASCLLAPLDGANAVHIIIQIRSACEYSGTREVQGV
jgi:hypothetical protein